MTDGGAPEDDWRASERDYYALLGVARDASHDAIRTSYRTLSREFHPDRRRHAQDVALAHEQYPILDRAYKVLCDPTTRRVYDLYGEQGVQALEQDTKLETGVGTHLKSADELQRHVEDVMRRLNQQALEGQFTSFSEMTMHVDASDLVKQPMRGMQSLLHRGRRYVDRTEMTIHQRTVFPISRQTNLTIGGYMYDKHGMGMGSFTTQLAYTSADPNVPSVTVATELGWTPKLHCQITQPVSPHTVVLLVPELDDHGLDIAFGANQVLAPQLNGAMMYSTRDGMSASMSHDKGDLLTTAAVAVNNAGPNLTLQVRRMFAASMTLKANVRASLLGGVSLVLGASKEVSRRTRLALGVMLAHPGVTLRLGFTRGSVRFVMPIFLSPFSAQTAFSTFCAATTPFLVSALVNQLIKPAQERQARRALQQRRERRIEYLVHARESALAQQRLMMRCANEKFQAEQTKERAHQKGLVIIIARYGENPTSPDARVNPEGEHWHQTSTSADLDSDVDTEDSPSPNARVRPTDEATAAVAEQKWVDVTIPLRFFVQDSTLSLHATSKTGLLGFYNPCSRAEDQAQTTSGSSARKPQLYVRYAFDGRVFEATFEDEQVVQLPSRHAHLMGPTGVVY